MFVQTNSLTASLPVIAEQFVKHDVAKAEWRVVEWDSVAPAEVKAEQVKVVEQLWDRALDSPRKVENRFPSRTAALRASERSLRDVKDARSEKGHWGVWAYSLSDEKVRRYRSVLPFAIAVAEEAKPVEEPVTEPVAEAQAAVAPVVKNKRK